MKDYSQSIKNLPKDIRGSKNGHWKGGIHYRKDGYVLVRKGIISHASTGTKYHLLHRLVMEKKLKRKLLRNEIVHHIDGNKSNNDISNLEILLNQSIHAKIHYPHRKRNNKGQFI